MQTLAVRSRPSESTTRFDDRGLSRNWQRICGGLSVETGVPPYVTRARRGAVQPTWQIAPGARKLFLDPRL